MDLKRFLEPWTLKASRTVPEVVVSLCVLRLGLGLPEDDRVGDGAEGERLVLQAGGPCTCEVRKMFGFLDSPFLPSTFGNGCATTFTQTLFTSSFSPSNQDCFLQIWEFIDPSSWTSCMRAPHPPHFICFLGTPPDPTRELPCQKIIVAGTT